MQVKKEKNNPLKWIIFAILVTYVVSIFIPVLWSLITSVKPNIEYNLFENKIGLPQKIELNNFLTAWKSGDAHAIINGEIVPFSVPVQFLYTILYAGGCMLTSTLTPCVVAYAAAKFKYKFSKIIYSTVIVAMILPIVGSLPSEIQMTQSLGIFDTFWGLWIMKANFLGIYFLVFFAQFKMIPYDYTEAGKIDGASNLCIMTKIILPLAKTTIGTVMLLTFIMYWNDYQIPLVYLPSFPVVAVGMYQFNQSLDQMISNVPTRISYMIIMAIPILTVFLIFHKKLLTNLSIGGIKG